MITKKKKLSSQKSFSLYDNIHPLSEPKDGISLKRNPKLWGQDLWRILHWATYMFPKDASRIDKLEFISFFEKIIPGILPCKKCGINFLNHLRKRPIDFESKNSLILWLSEVHNMTNESLGKPKYNSQLIFKKLARKDAKELVDRSLIKFNIFMRDHLNFGTTCFLQNYAGFLRFVYKYV
jgi:hypothetical protein